MSSDSDSDSDSRGDSESTSSCVLTEHLLSLADDTQRDSDIHNYLYDRHPTTTHWKPILYRYKTLLLDHYADMIISTAPRFLARKIQKCQLHRYTLADKSLTPDRKSSSRKYRNRMLGNVTVDSMNEFAQFKKSTRGGVTGRGTSATHSASSTTSATSSQSSQPAVALRVRETESQAVTPSSVTPSVGLQLGRNEIEMAREAAREAANKNKVVHIPV
jgi:hypothetical protein